MVGGVTVHVHFLLFRSQLCQWNPDSWRHHNITFDGQRHIRYHVMIKFHIWICDPISFGWIFKGYNLDPKYVFLWDFWMIRALFLQVLHPGTREPRSSPWLGPLKTGPTHLEHSLHLKAGDEPMWTSTSEGNEAGSPTAMINGLV